MPRFFFSAVSGKETEIQNSFEGFTIVSDKNQDVVPNFKYQGQTLVAKSNNNCARNVLSLVENTTGDFGLAQAMKAGVQKALTVMIPAIISNVRSELKTKGEIVLKKLEELKKDMDSQVDSVNQRAELMVL